MCTFEMFTCLFQVRQTIAELKTSKDNVHRRQLGGYLQQKVVQTAHGASFHQIIHKGSGCQAGQPGTREQLHFSSQINPKKSKSN